MKKFFNIKRKYKFEMNDLRTFLTFVNIVLIMCDFTIGAIFGFTVAFCGVIGDLLNKERHINNLVMHLLSVGLNTYFLIK